MAQPKLSPALLEQARRLTAEHPNDIIAFYSLDSKLRYASPSHLTILGYTEAEALGQPWTRFIAPEDRSHADLSGSATMLHGRSIEFGFHALTKYGERVSMRGVAWLRADPAARAPYLVFHGIPQPEAKGAFVIRGFSLGKTAADPEFDALRAMLLSKGYHVYPSRSLWDRHTVSQYADEFRPYYEANHAKYNLLIGGSLGAVAAFKLAPELRPDLLVLCSLSPVFADDKGEYVKRLIGPKRTADLESVSPGKITEAISEAGIKTILTYGEREVAESPELVARVKATAAKIKGAQLHEIPRAGHQLRDPEYVAGLDALLS
jgi:PAS domain S-box-containing protein